MNDQPSTTRVTGSTPAIFVTELIERHSNAIAAEMLGVSPSVASEARKNQMVRVPVERLAERIIADEDREALAHAAILVLRVPRDKIEGLKAVCGAMGLKPAEIGA